MNTKRRHLFTTLAFTILTALCLSLLTWALVKGAVFESSNRGVNSSSFNRYPNKIYTREKDPGTYWLVIGLLGFFSTLFALLTILEFRSYRIAKRHRLSNSTSTDLLAKIDKACNLYPESKDVLLHAKSVILSLNSPTVEIALDDLLNKILKAPTLQDARTNIQSLANALQIANKLQN